MKVRIRDRKAAEDRAASRHAQGWARGRPLSANVVRSATGQTLAGASGYEKPALAALAQRGGDRPLLGKGGLGIARPRR